MNLLLPLTKGIVAVYKPVGPTSHDIVNQIRGLTGEKRVGHAGTLDPLASGVLVVGIGRQATKMLGSIVQKEKEYIATIMLGQTSETDDSEKIVETNSKNQNTMTKQIPSIHKLKEIIQTFVGTIDQVPPIYSALKVNGQPAYKRARKGTKVEMKARKVKIYTIEILTYTWPTLHLRVVTGPGVYIRSLARDIGVALGVGAYLGALERTRVGQYTRKMCCEVMD